MRIESIDFIAFGPFTNLLLDFNGNIGGLDIVFGYNEAGKSVALRGFKALLYGIEERTTDNFIHDNKNLRIGGRIARSDGSTLAFIRRKGRINTLLNPDGTSIKDDILKGFLGDTTEELFSRLFGINHVELITGGRAIASGQGDAGESLFAAGMGKIRLHDVIRGIESEADELFKPRGKKKINEAIEAFNNAKKEAAQNELSGYLWEEHREKLKEAGDKKSKLIQELQDLRKKHSHLERIKNSLPVIAKFKEASHELSLLGEFIILPTDFSDVRKMLLNNLRRDITISEDTDRQLKGLRDEAMKISIPDEMLKRANKIYELHKRLGSYQKAERDGKGLKGQIEQLNAEAAKILSELRPGLSIEEVESVRLPKIRRTKIRDTANKYTSSINALKDKEKSLKAIHSDIDKIEAALCGIQQPVDLPLLKTTLKTLQTNINLEDELQAERLKQQNEIKKTSTALKKLPLWDRRVEELEKIQVPMAETIEKFDLGFEELNSKLKMITEKINTANEKIKTLGAEINAVEHAGYIPSEADLTTARQWRQKGWNLVMGEWLHGKPDSEGIKEFAQNKPLYVAYEESVAKADDISDRLRTDADRVAKKAHLYSEDYKLKEEKARLENEKEEYKGRLNNLQAEWEGIWRPAGIVPLTPREMRSWLNSYRHLMEQSEKLNDCKNRIVEHEGRIQGVRREAVSNLKSAGLSIDDDSISLKNLLKITDAHLDKTEKTIKQIESLKDRLNELSRQKDRETAEIQSIEEEINRLTPEWSELLNELRLPAGASSAEVDAYLEIERELFIKIDQAKDLAKRIEGINRDATEFTDDVNKLTSLIAPDIKNAGAEQAVMEINSRFQKANEDFVRLEQITKQIKEKEALLSETNRSIQNSKASLKNMCLQAKCVDEGNLEEIEDKSARARRLNEIIEQSREHLLSYCGTGSLDEFIKEVEGEDVDSIDSRLLEIGRNISINEDKLSEINRTIGESENELKRMSGGANAAEAMEKAEGILAGIKKDAERYLRLRLASSILNYEIERYRQRKQSPLLKRAGEIFSRLTLNSFLSVEIDYADNDKAVLVCVRPSGEKLGVDAMSEGSCDQLYLSLRLATLEKYLDENEPLPFIVDDILVNFDDRRAESALKVLKGFAEKTQVIFFTHHSHLIEIAKYALPTDTLKIHFIEQKNVLFQ